MFPKVLHKSKKRSKEFKSPARSYCQYCGKVGRIQRHHIEYRSQGGEGTEKNRIDLCDRCNSLAHSKHPDYLPKTLYWKAYQDRKRVERLGELLSCQD